MAKTSMIAKLTTKPGRRGDLLAAFDKMLEAVNEEEGTEIYSFNVDTTDDDVLWIYELYTDDAGLQAHSGSDAMMVLITEIGDLLEGAPLLVPTTPVGGKGIGV